MNKNSVNTQTEALRLADELDGIPLADFTEALADEAAAELRRLYDENEQLKERQVLVAHPDDVAIDRFAAAMKAKMAKQRAKGYGGWEDKADCPTDRLQTMLVDHLPKGDPVDVGNFAMMLWNRGEHTAAPPPAQHLPDEVQLSKTSDLLPRLPEGNARGWWRDGKVNFEDVHLPKSGAFELFTYNQMREYAVAAIESSRPPAHELEQTAQQQELVGWVERDGELVWNNREAAIGRNLYTSHQPSKPLTDAEGISATRDALNEQSAQQEQIERTSVRSAGPRM